MVEEQVATLLEATEEKRQSTLSTKTIPTPSAEYRTHRKLMRAASAPGRPSMPVPIPIPVPTLFGPRVLMWKQDPSVPEIGIRKAFIPTLASSGPRDARIQTTGMPIVAPNAMGDFIQVPLTPEFDAVHTFAVVRMTLTMYQRALATGPSAPALPWQWNTPSNTDPILVAPYHSQMMNAFYSRGQKLLAFGFFPKPGAPAGSPKVYTCRSLDIVSHECGHAILDALKPQWITSGATPQTGALHEAFGDLTAIFVALSQFDQVEAVVAQTKSNLHDKTFLSDVAEEFGLALGRPNGLRNADNDLRMSQVGTEVHSLSQVFTGAMYDILADIFGFERKPALRDDALTLYDRAGYLRSLLLRGIAQAPATNANFADVANQMLAITATDANAGRLTTAQAAAYRQFIRNRFIVREVVVSPVPLTDTAGLAGVLQTEVAATERLIAAPHIADGQPQNREGCCGTMTLPENSGVDEAIERERREFLSAITAELESHKKPTR